MDKRFLAILGVIVAIFIVIFAISSGGNDNQNSKSGNSAQATHHVTGQGQKGVTLVEYGDFQCPVCFGYEPTMEQLRQKYSSDIFFQFRNLPLVQVHPNAFAGARAAEAAGLQGKYWQMHDMLYKESNWQVWTNSHDPQTSFNSYAQQLGLNVEQFKKDWAGQKTNDAINADLAAFPKDFRAATGAFDPNKDTATPTFFLDGKFIDNSQVSDSNGPSLAKFTQIIDAEITKKNSSNKQ